MRRAVLALAVALGGCGYSNALYNARQRFGDAERAAAHGDRMAAEAAWREAIDRAAVSLRREPQGRWSDDALLLVGRSQFGLGQYDRAAAALRRVVDESPDASVRAHGRLWLGAAMVARARPVEGIATIDTALVTLVDAADVAHARLWRGRALLALQRPADAWPDLDTAARHDGLALAAHLDIATAAIAVGDSARFADAVRRAVEADAARAADTVSVLTGAATQRFGPAFIDAVLVRIDRVRMPADARDRLRLRRADIAASAGDRAAAIALARGAAGGAGPVAGLARARIAHWRLRDASDEADLAAARTELLPALADPAARALHDSIAATERLLEQAGGDDRPLALYAAAELARDGLGAPVLARRLFLAYADADPGCPWAAKAALAAAALGAEPALVQARLHAGPDNVYVAALHGRDTGAAFAESERRLAQALAVLRAGAVANAGARRGPGRIVDDTFPMRTP